MPASGHQGEPPPERGGAYTYLGPVRWEYAPELDGDPDPGEVVWTWVAFEDDPRIGKDRPVAVVGRVDEQRDAGSATRVAGSATLVALMLSTRDHAGDPDWVAIGSGPWDRDGRESWVRRDRLLAVPADAVRREGAILPRETYAALIAQASGQPAARPRRGLIRRLLRR